MKAISKGSLVGCLVHMDAGSADRLAQQSHQIPEHAYTRTLPSWLYDARLPVRDRLPQVALMPFWLLPYPVNPNHLPLLTYNRCSTLDVIGDCAELTTSKLIRGRYTL